MVFSLSGQKGLVCPSVRLARAANGPKKRGRGDKKGGKMRIRGKEAREYLTEDEEGFQGKETTITTPPPPRT